MAGDTDGLAVGLLGSLREIRAAWERVLAEVGAEGLRRLDAGGGWSLADVLAHFTGWDRWQLVQLESAFDGREPSEHELIGDTVVPARCKRDARSLGAMGRHVKGLGLSGPTVVNRAFVESARTASAGTILREWREFSARREAFVTNAAPGRLAAVVGADWTSAGLRVIRLASECPDVQGPTSVARFLHAQLHHQRQHLNDVHVWTNLR